MLPADDIARDGAVLDKDRSLALVDVAAWSLPPVVMLAYSPACCERGSLVWPVNWSPAMLSCSSVIVFALCGSREVTRVAILHQ